MKRTIIFMGIVALMAQSCITALSTRMWVEQDDIKNTRRVFRTTYFGMNDEIFGPFLSLEKLVAKEVRSDGFSIMIYDKMRLSEGSYPLENYVYIAADDAKFEVPFLFQESRTDMEFEPNSKDAQHPHGKRECIQMQKMNYALTAAQVEAIVNAKQVRFRYYSGVQMITVKLEGRHLRKFKEIFAAN